MYHVSWPWDGIGAQGSQLVLARLKGNAFILLLVNYSMKPSRS